MATSQIDEPSQDIVLTTKFHNSHCHKINLRTIIPDEYDMIQRIVFEFPEQVESVRLILGNYSLYYDRDNIHELEKLPIFLSACKSANVYLAFMYDKEWIQTQQTYTYEDDMDEIEEFGDEDIEIFDGNMYHTGNKCMLERFPTANRYRNSQEVSMSPPHASPFM